MSADMRSGIEPHDDADSEPESTPAVLDGAHQEPVEIRGRAGAHAFVALVAGVTAVAYAWRIGGGDAASAWWAVVAVLGAVTAVNLATWVGAGVPRMVADEHGVRVRHRRAWTGIPWSQVESVRVEPAGRRLGDAVLVVQPVDGEAEHVAYGTCATVSAEDLPRALAELRQASENSPVVLTQSPPAAVPDGEPAPDGEPVPDAPPPQPSDAPAPDAAAPDAAAPGAPVPDAVSEREPRAVAAGARLSQPLRMVTTARRAARAQVHREGPATVGSSALQHDAALLPEISELRRTEGRVGLVIESVTTASGTQRVAEPTRPPQRTAVDAAPVEAYPTQPAAEPRIGPVITQARRQLRMGIDDLAERTRIRPHVIESIEVDDFVPCGGDFYARGHLRSLCRTLGIDATPLLETYDREYAQAPVAARRVFEAELATGPQPSIRRVNGGPRWSALIAVVMVLAIVWAVADYVSSRTEQSTPPPAATPSSQPAPSADPERFAGLGAPVMNELRFSAVGGPSRVVVRDAEGGLVWRGRLRRGETEVLDVAGAATARILDAGNVRVRVNGNGRGTLGEPGKTVRTTLGRRPAR
ncbi:MAG: helix-turn-helix domain-containing protein [Actinomycetota bacterium]|nr:helix-turn-helix domain-containing protein [Actinomycetota bacterium]